MKNMEIALCSGDFIGGHKCPVTYKLMLYLRKLLISSADIHFTMKGNYKDEMLEMRK